MLLKDHTTAVMYCVKNITRCTKIDNILKVIYFSDGADRSVNQR